jgi:hypothetical protein
MKTAAFALFGFVACSLQLCADSPPAPKINLILAVVNDEPITSADVNDDPQYADDYNALTAARLPPDQFEAKEKDLHLLMVARLIYRRLIVQEFHREGYYFSTAELDTRYAAYLKTELNNDEKRLRAALAWRGETMDEFRNWFEEKTIVEWMTRENVDSKITATTPADKEAQRKTLRDAWYASLRAKACIEFTMGSSTLQLPPTEP